MIKLNLTKEELMLIKKLCHLFNAQLIKIDGGLYSPPPKEKNAKKD